MTNKALPRLSAKKLPNLSEKKENIFTRLKKMPSLEDKQRKFEIQKNKDIPVLPDVPKEQVDVKYPLLAPYAFAHIKWDPDARELVYRLEEPQLELNEQRILNLLEEGIKELLNISFLATSKGETIVEYLA